MKISAHSHPKRRTIDGLSQGEGEKIAAKSFEVFKQEPDLAIFLLKLKALEQFLQNRTTLILDESAAPLDLLKSQKPLGGKK